MKKSGFTLIELSIVLVIIGLIVGGVLVGQDLIRAATIRAQVSQLEKLQTAVNTFKIKYNGLPGDLLSTTATSLGFFASVNGPARPWGDGNGILESGSFGCSVAGATNCFYAEFLMFFRHLSDAKLIDGNYSPDSLITTVGRLNGLSTSFADASQYMPIAKIGHNALITTDSYNSVNYFTISGFSTLGLNGYYGAQAGVNPLSAQEAFQIDSKLDDGKPNSGSILAIDTAGDISSNLIYWVATSTLPNCVTGGTDYTLSNANIGACSLSVKIR